ncbi:ABC transporter substrate-binding protein [Actinopolymorpha alba]|uniref:ABC transporter substrate-binding protein n=1 Tax=Actinopolymorpha alba TaxID=533267 RepID=UPI00036F6366|nr:ABC transporter substrate-binding protein [Actinopolymorpha alba]
MANRLACRGITATVGVAVLTLGAVACGGTGSTTADQAANVDCKPYKKYGDLSGKQITVYTSIVAPEDQPHINSYKPFEQCTGAKVVYEGSKEFEAQVVVRAKSGNAPDIAYVPQPGLLQTLVRDTKAVKPASKGVVDNVDKYFGKDWKSYGTVDGAFYAAPIGANVKSFVWYSPKQFAKKGYQVPQTWDDMIALSDQIVKDGGKPWCAGIGSGEATGWPATDWMEDVMLRMYGPDVYNQWVTHKIPFNDPKVAAVLAKVGSILKNPDYVNGGLGDVTSVASTTFQDAGLPILDGTCFLHRQASFYQANWPEGTKVGKDGDVYAFYLPPINKKFGKPVLGGGEFAVAFSDRPEVVAFQEFLSSPEWANLKAKEGNWISANTGLDIANVDTPVNKLSVQLLQDPNAVFRFDGSDLMPGEVGAGSFWTEMTNWIANNKPDKQVLNAIERSWPK